MFEKRKDNQPNAPMSPKTAPQDSFSAGGSAQAASGRAAVIGPKIHVNGEISGDENLVIEGRVDGKVNLKEHQVDIGQSGKVHADVAAKTVRISGEVRGDINGHEKVIISRTGNVCGNIVAPRLTLEDGAKFKGSIDMDPGGAAASEKQLSAVKAPEKAQPPKPAAPKQAAQKPPTSANGDKKQSSLAIKGR